jgi:hypothetical protein
MNSLQIAIRGYVIKCDISANILSHDWGTEFYHDKQEAEARADELSANFEGEFSVQKVNMVFEEE